MKYRRQQPWIYVEELKSVASSHLSLPSDEARHTVCVLRCRPGDAIVAFDGFGRVRAGCLAIERKNYSLQFTEPLQYSHEPMHSIQLLLCLPNHVATLEEILRKTCELGIQHIQPIFSERTERLHWSSDVWQQRSKRWRRILIEACKQAKNPFLPQLHAPIPLNQLQQSSLGYCIYGTLENVSSQPSHLKNNSFLEKFSPPPTATCFSCIVGSEGGFSPDEEAFLTKISRGICLPTCVLRTETAVVSLLTILKILCNNAR